MDEFIKMDIFFFVTTFCIVFLTVMIGFVIWKLLRILKHIERIAEVAGKEAENIREDAAYVRGRLLGVLDTIFSFMPRSRRRDE
jgi:hypothetical protein